MATGAALDAANHVTLKARVLYDEHLSEHYDKHASKHVGKVSSVVGEQLENANNLYKLHLEEKIEKAKKATTGHANKIYETATGLFMSVPAKVHDVIAPKIEMVLSHFPEHGDSVPDALHDRLLLFTALIGLFVLYIFVGLKMSAKIVKFSLCLAKFAFSWAWFVVTLPFHIMTCGMCRKRAAKDASNGATGSKKGKQTFSKPPANGNGAKVSGKNKKK